MAPLLTRRCLALALLALPVALSACASAGRLGEYDFRDRALAVVMIAPPRPDVFTGSVPEIPDDSASLGETLLRAGSEIVRGVEEERLRERLDEAAANVDVEAVLAERTLERASRILRARPVEEIRDADFELEIRIQEYGIRANDWNAQAFFFVKAQVLLLDAADGSLIWRTGVEESEAVNRATDGLNQAATNVVTAATFATLPVEAIERALRGLAEFAAEEAARKLQAGMDKAREERAEG